MAFWNSTQELYDEVLSYKKLHEYIHENECSIRDVEKIVDEICADYSATFVRNAKRVFDLSLKRLYSGIKWIPNTEVDVVNLANTHNLVLVPNHQSYADFLSIPYLFYSAFNIPIHIASGINMNFWPMGFVFRQGGAFFIRRTFKGDTLYKLTLEAYLNYLLRSGKTLKFYFEGKRSRTGKLMSPRFGLFQMILEAHSHIENAKPLCFLPISLSHEYIPDFGQHEKELMGEKKRGESATQMIRIIKIIRRKLGFIHMKIGKPVFPTHDSDQRKVVQRLAFDCFRAVGAGTMVTPKTLLSLILLDHVTGVQTWDSILARCRAIVKYCKDAGIPLTENLKREDIEKPARGVLELLEKNKRLKVIRGSKLGKTLYQIPDDYRHELVYHKNTILHHFLIPLFINTAWINVFRGNIKDVKELRKFFLQQRRILRYEFYLPEANDMFEQIRNVLQIILERKEFLFSDAVELSSQEMFKVGQMTGVFSSAFAYIYEGYYLAAEALKHHANDDSFTFEQFQETCHEIFQIEKEHGRMVRFPESYSVPLMKSALSYFVGTKLVEEVDDKYRLKENADMDEIIEQFVQILADMLTMNVKLIKDTVG
jgi:glycerol-3-phosphate O-acyltransferase